MSYGIVKQSGGYVDVQTQAWSGTSFTIYLPCTEASPSQPAQAGVASAAAGSETVLVVEDEAVVRDLAKRILERLGYQVLVAAGSREGLRIVAEHGGSIDLLVTDVIMPHMSGIEFARSAHDVRPTLPVLFMSGYTDDELGRGELLDSQVPFLQKPFSPETLGRKVRDTIERARSGGEQA